MPDFKLIEVQERPYVYVDCSCAMDPPAISETMGKAFQTVFGFMQENGLTATDGALSVYYTYNPETVDFRVGFFVSAEDAKKASGAVKGDVTPAGRVVHFTHHGSYAKLSESYGALMVWLEQEGLPLGSPTWEVYTNGPETVPEDQLVTEIYVGLA
ncbi:GyrI-like domain-containing protein [Oricola sp.]|uniref:GyrI-like domain-containing protein n=1 Tax=Oricola sp. TaxID=1979950 RepID=UPI0025FB558A|nr:GyrI-like domain-containing protein [Oricola sp.]MCI5073654.1 GyrI-like domain-containing protein [Oricola sp.]